MAYLEDMLGEVLARLTSIETKVNRALGMALGDARRDKDMATKFDKIEKEVAEMGDAVTAAETAFADLAERIRDTAGDQEKAEALAAELDGHGRRLAEAVVKNTPHDPSGNQPVP